MAPLKTVRGRRGWPEEAEEAAAAARAEHLVDLCAIWKPMWAPGVGLRDGCLKQADAFSSRKSRSRRPSSSCITLHMSPTSG